MKTGNIISEDLAMFQSMSVLIEIQNQFIYIRHGLKINLLKHGIYVSDNVLLEIL